MTAKQKFKIGQCVKLSQAGQKANLNLKSNFGVVTGFCLSPFHVRVKLEGQKSDSRYCMRFWE